MSRMLTETETPLAEARTKRILVVDDEDETCELLSVILQNEGFNVLTSFDGQDALAKVKQEAPDLIMLDIMLPRRGGYEVLRALQQGTVGKIPVVVMTGRCIDRTTCEMIRQEPNVVDFMRKPIRLAPLAMFLNRTLRTKRSDQSKGCFTDPLL